MVSTAGVIGQKSTGSSSARIEPEINAQEELKTRISRWFEESQNPSEGRLLGRQLLELQTLESIAQDVCYEADYTARARFRAAELGGTADECQLLYRTLLHEYQNLSLSSLQTEKVRLLFEIIPSKDLCNWLVSLADSSLEKDFLIFNKIYLQLVQEEREEYPHYEYFLRELTPLLTDATMQGLSLSTQPIVMSRLAQFSSDKHWEEYLLPAVSSSPHLKETIVGLINNIERIKQLITHQLNAQYGCMANSALGTSEFLSGRPNNDLSLRVLHTINALYDHNEKLSKELWKEAITSLKQRIGPFSFFERNPRNQFLCDELSHWQLEALLQTYTLKEICSVLSDNQLNQTGLTQATLTTCALWAYPDDMDQLLDCVEKRCQRDELGTLCGFLLHPTSFMRPWLHAPMIRSCLKQVEWNETATKAFLQNCIYRNNASMKPNFFNTHLYVLFLEANERVRETAFQLIGQAIERDHGALSQIFSALICSPHYQSAPQFMIPPLGDNRSACTVTVGLEQALNYDAGQTQAFVKLFLEDKAFTSEHLHALLDWSINGQLAVILNQLSSEAQWSTVAEWLHLQLAEIEPNGEQKNKENIQTPYPIEHLMNKHQLRCFLNIITADQLEKLLQVREFDTHYLGKLIESCSSCEQKKEKLSLVGLPTVKEREIHEATNSSSTAQSLNTIENIAKPMILSFLEDQKIYADDFASVGLDWHMIWEKLKKAFTSTSPTFIHHSIELEMLRLQMHEELTSFLRENNIPFNRNCLLNFLRGNPNLRASL